jgi:hypothetical protein
MKKSVLLIALFIFFALEASAQMNPFTAKEGYSAALSKAQSSLTNPELLLVAIGSADQEILPVTPDFNFDNGEAMIWLYAFQESDQSSYKAFAVVKIPIIGFQATAIPFDQLVPMLPFQPKGKITTTDWIDSDEMIETFRLESKVQEYLDGGNVPEIYFVGIFNISDNPILPDNRTYWILTLMDDNLPLTCAMDAVTKEVWCGVQLSDVVGFTARTAYAAAQEKAVEKGLIEPQTLLVMTMKTGIEDLPITNKFDFQKGTASYWVYHFREYENPNKMAAFIAWNDNLGGYVMHGFDVDIIMELMPVSPFVPLEDENWVDSDYMINVFNQHQYFSEFMAEHPDPWSFVIGVFTNEDNPQLDPFMPYWGISIVDDEVTRDSLACVMSLETEDIICGTVLSNNEFEQSKLTLCPNPATSQITLSLGEEFISAPKIDIIDYLGNVIRWTPSARWSPSDKSITINTSSLSPGVYFMRVRSEEKMEVRKFVVI